nr:RNA-directed DNA polymerase, eukaryota [Tanacetum cinerariifolium]
METSSQPLSDAKFWILVMRPDVELTRGMMNGENNVLVANEYNGSWWRVTNNVTVEGSNLVVGGDPNYQDAGFDDMITQTWNSISLNDSNAMSVELEAPISRDEIRKDVWDCGENKSPGQDGFTFEFFRRFWNIVGPDLC